MTAIRRAGSITRVTGTGKTTITGMGMLMGVTRQGETMTTKGMAMIVIMTRS